jgi:hypothetical protein
VRYDRACLNCSKRVKHYQMVAGDGWIHYGTGARYCDPYDGERFAPMAEPGRVWRGSELHLIPDLGDSKVRHI